MISKSVRVWEKVEIALEAAKICANPYTDVTVWVDLEGPGFAKRVYGFWDGGNLFRVRVLATVPGVWSWRSGSNQDDAGLNNITGQFPALEWDEADKAANPCRRGFLQTHVRFSGKKPPCSFRYSFQVYLRVGIAGT